MSQSTCLGGDLRERKSSLLSRVAFINSVERDGTCAECREKQRDLFVVHSCSGLLLSRYSFRSLPNLRGAVLPSVLDLGLTPKLSSLLPPASDRSPYSRTTKFAIKLLRKIG